MDASALTPAMEEFSKEAVCKEKEEKPQGVILDSKSADIETVLGTSAQV